MLCSRLSTTLLLVATCFLMRAGVSKADPVLPSRVILSTQRVITCDDNGNVQRLSCASGVIGVQAALYGRTNADTCSFGRPRNQVANIKCSQRGTLEVFKQRCDGKKECELNTNIFKKISDPCFGIYKYFDTTFACFQATHVVACEHSFAILQCDQGQVIFVYSANYGRHDRTTCSYQRPQSQLGNVQCSRPTTKVAESCNGKSSCAVRAGNYVFGDPCFGTYKYLEVAYTCDYPRV